MLEPCTIYGVQTGDIDEFRWGQRPFIRFRKSVGPLGGWGGDVGESLGEIPESLTQEWLDEQEARWGWRLLANHRP